MKVAKQFASPSSAIVLLLLLGMSPPAAVKAKSTPLEPAVRKLVEDHCGRCHNSTHETAKPAALKVFDLKEDNWTASMSDVQLPRVNGRFATVDVTTAERKQVADFIKGKVQERAALKR
jgi:hypothetical protein